MRTPLVAIAGFALGAASGAVSAWYILRKRYEEQTQEEVDSVKEMYSRKLAKKNAELKERYDIPKRIDEEDEDQVAPEIEPEEVKKAEELIEKLDYTRYSEKEKPEPVVEEVSEKKQLGVEKPYIISEEEYEENEEYEKISLTWYADKILADDMDDVVEDPGAIVGFENLGYLKEGVSDEILVRNDRLKCDYNVELSLQTYEEVLEMKPYLRRGVL